MEKVGIIIARCQPIHNGHIALIREALKSNNMVCVILGSANKFNVRNPIPIHVREELVNNSILEVFNKSDSGRIVVATLDDLSSEENNTIEWGFYLYAHIVELINQAFFTIYYSDGFETIVSWFPGFLLRNFVSLSLMARGSIEEGISATSVREYIMNGNDEKLKTSVPNYVFEQRDVIRRYIELSLMK